MWLTCRKAGREGASAHCRRVSSRPPDGREQLQGIKAGRGCDKRDGVRVHQDRLGETRASLCYSPASQSVLEGAGRTVDCLVIMEFRIFMNSVDSLPRGSSSASLLQNKS